jgi:CheY-like chemotaxis protein
MQNEGTVQPSARGNTIETANKILIVDDDRVYGKILSRFFEERGFEVLVAENGVNAAWMAAREQPGLILLDHFLPGADGLTVLDRLRRAGATSDIPVIYLTGSDSKALGQKAKTDGVLAVFRKGDLDEADFMWTVNRVFGIKTARERWKTFETPDEAAEPELRPDEPPPSEIADGSDPWA